MKNSEMLLQVNQRVASVLKLKSHFINSQRNLLLKNVLMRAVIATAQAQSITES
jgi:hypothetical protein